jgi:hypothetical protein
MKQPKDVNLEIATTTLEQLKFELCIDWQQGYHHQLARYIRGDLQATLVLQNNFLTVAFSSAKDHTTGAPVPKGAGLVAKALKAAGVAFVARPEGVL